MEEEQTFYIEKNGTKYKATILTDFEFLGNIYSIYTLPTINKEINVYCDKLINNYLVPIQNKEEQDMIQKIVKKIFSVTEERKNNMEQETFKMKNEFGQEKNARILNIVEIQGQRYIIYSIEEDEENESVYASKIVKNSQGEDEIIAIENDNERKIVFDSITNILNELE